MRRGRRENEKGRRGLREREMIHLKPVSVLCATLKM